MAKNKTRSHFELRRCFFINPQTGFICGENYLGKSTDGGLTWKSAIPDSLNETFTNLFFPDANNGWVTGSNFLLRTRDGGATWQKAIAAKFFDVQFFDANNGYGNTNENTTQMPRGLYKTSDAGTTFQFLIGISEPILPHGLFFLNQNKGWFSDSYLNKTENAGVSFSKSSSTMEGGYAIQFTDELHGWVAGGRSVYRTVDGGITLEQIAGPDVPAGDIHFFDNDNGFVLSGHNIYSTTNGGKLLIRQCTINKAQLYEIHFTDSSHGWATGKGGFVYRYVKP